MTVNNILLKQYYSLLQRSLLFVAENQFTIDLLQGLSYNYIMQKYGSGQTVQVNARAKVNLGLNIVGAKGNMHLIDTIIVPIAICDTVTVYQSGNFAISYHDGRSYAQDTALKAARLISDAYGTPPVGIQITKRIPEGKGLGGSSADAAGVTRAMRQLFSLPDIPAELLLQIGSDVPAMYTDKPVRVSGIGEKVQEVSIDIPYMLLLLPSCSINTGEAYVLYDTIGGSTADIDGILQGASLPTNALQKAATVLQPQLAGLEAILTQAGLHPVMTGSGSAFVGITKSRRQYAKAKQHILSIGSDGLNIEAYGLNKNNTERLCQKAN